MKISTFSVIAGNGSCNAQCPFCVSKMTGGIEYIEGTTSEFNSRNFAIACQLAKQSNVTTAMITGKGEPTLYPKQITQYVRSLNDYDIPLIELQTNGILLSDEEYLKKWAHHWYINGLTTIAISVVHYDQEVNRSIYCPDKEHFDLHSLIQRLHLIGFSVRISCILLKGYANTNFVNKMIGYARNSEAEQLTFVPLNLPAHSWDDTISNWTKDHQPNAEDVYNILNHLNYSGHGLMELPHGAAIFDVDGQNVCLSNCLGKAYNYDEFRNLIFYPSGRIAYDWQYSGAVIL